MYRGKTFLAIIPARGGSVRLPDKNIRHLRGKPMIWYTAEAIHKSGIFDCVLLNTDDMKIAEVALECGVGVPFIRPKELATRDSLVADAIAWMLEKLDEEFDYVLVLSPATPLVSYEDIRIAAGLLLNRDADMVVSVTSADWNSSHHSFILPVDNSLKGIVPNAQLRSSEMRQRTCLNGAIYLAKYEVFAEKKDYYSLNTYAYQMPQDRSIEIDYLEDFERVEHILGKRDAKRKSFWKVTGRVIKRLLWGRFI